MPLHTTRNPEERAFHIAKREADALWKARGPEGLVDYFDEACTRTLQYAHELKGGLPPQPKGLIT